MGKQTDKLIAKLRKVTEKGTIRLALDMHGELVETTPVDKGWARANWVPSVGQPQTEPIGSPEHIDNNAATVGTTEVLRWKVTSGPIYISNNVPYIRRLNEGSSKQAPKGFVEKAVKRAVRKANQRVL